MAVTLESVTTQGPENRDVGENTVITKPASLAEGDLMVAHITVTSPNGGTPTISSVPSGWSALLDTTEDGGSFSVRQGVYYKVATGSEGASYSWTTGATGGQFAHGAIYRITGYGGVPIGAADGTTGGTFVNTVTPPTADCLLLFLISGGGNNASGSVSGYAIATDNPTWTERYDAFGGPGGSDEELLAAGATAPRTAVTATGNSSATIDTFTGVFVGAMVVVQPPVSVTVSPAVVTMTSSVQAPSVSGGATVSPSVITMTSSVQAPVISVTDAKWTNVDKSTTISPTNTPKS